jgi:hypothetical protein
MTPKFDQFYESLIREYTTAKSKRRESRYWADSMFPKSGVRQVRSMNNKSSSQRTKLGNQQYIGDYWDSSGIRGQNKSEKEIPNVGIAKGLGGHIRIDGVNAKKRGAKFNSKQGNMEIKYTLNNGLSKVGSTGKTKYAFTEPRHFDK